MLIMIYKEIIIFRIVFIILLNKLLLNLVDNYLIREENDVNVCLINKYKFFICFYL